MINNPAIYGTNNNKEQPVRPIRMLPKTSTKYEADKKKKQQKKLLTGSLLALGIAAAAFIMIKNGNKPTNAFQDVKSMDIGYKFTDYGERMKEVNDNVRKFIINPFKKSESGIDKYNLSGTSRRLILYGKPGCGKTTYGRAIAKEIADASGKQTYYTTVSCTEFTSSFVGEHENKIKGFFDNLIKLVKANPDTEYVLQMDECDQLFTKITDARGSADLGASNGVNLMKEYLDVKTKDIPNLTIIGTTNEEKISTGIAGEFKLGNMDTAILDRFGGLQCAFEVLPPTLKEATEGFIRHIKKGNTSEEQFDERLKELIKPEKAANISKLFEKYGQKQLENPNKNNIEEFRDNSTKLFINYRFVENLAKNFKATLKDMEINPARYKKDGWENVNQNDPTAILEKLINDLKTRN